jgi:hypothetical protein
MMHLGLMERPFVPHNLISAQDSPVPLPKFQMASKLKILMSSGSKRGTQIYYPFLSKKSQQANPLQVPQQGPYGQRYLLTGHFYILVSLDISLYLKRPCEKSVHVPQKWAPMETDTHARALLNISSRVPNKGALHTEPLQRETLHS